MSIGPATSPSPIPIEPVDTQKFRERFQSALTGQQIQNQSDYSVLAQQRLEQQQTWYNEQLSAMQQAQARASNILQQSKNQSLYYQNLYQQYANQPMSGSAVYTGSGSIAQTMAVRGQNIAPGNVQGLINYAKSWLGTPYSWGGGTIKGPSRGISQGRNTVGFDCSSFVQNVFNKIGIKLPRTASKQFAAGIRISKDQLRPGDLVVYGGKKIHHIAIYIGNGKIIESPRTGLTVRVTSMGNATGFARVGNFQTSNTGSIGEGVARRSTGNEFDRFFNAIRKQESGGNYKAVNRTSGALGAYQIMPGNIPSWSKRALGYKITASQFLANRTLQDKIARYMLNYYYRKYGVRGAAIAWYAGESRAKKMQNVSGGKGYPTSYGYVEQILAKM